MKNKILITTIFVSLLMCFSCKKNEPPVQEYYLVVYNETSDTIYVSYQNSEYKTVLFTKQFDTQIDNPTYEKLWTDGATQNLSIYKQDSIKKYLPQSIFLISTNDGISDASPFGEFTTYPTWNGQQYERHFKTFSVTDKMFASDSIHN